MAVAVVVAVAVVLTSHDIMSPCARLHVGSNSLSSMSISPELSTSIFVLCTPSGGDDGWRLSQPKGVLYGSARCSSSGRPDRKPF